jgi:calcineurin-like phosphoesterase family protein
MEWITADIHFGHANIISYCDRPYDTVREMNEDIIRRWNTQVQPRDLVWVLGDVCMGQLVDTIPLIGRLNGMKVLCPGNHDPIWSGAPRKRQDKWRAEFSSHFTAIHPEVFTGTPENDIPVTVSHFPYHGHDHRDFDEHRPIDKGRWLLHGHVHDLYLQRGRQINVGLDAWGGWLASKAEILELITHGANELGCREWSK